MYIFSLFHFSNDDQDDVVDTAVVDDDNNYGKDDTANNNEINNTCIYINFLKNVWQIVLRLEGKF